MRKIVTALLVTGGVAAGLVALSAPGSANPGTRHPWVVSDQRSVNQTQPGQSPATVRIGCGVSATGMPYSATSGGYRIDSGPLQVIATEPIAPTSTIGVEWRVAVDSTAGAGVLTVWAVCIDPSGI